MPAATLQCPTCGAAASSDADHCAYCRSRLATVSCPDCFGMLLRGSRHCPHCGAAAAREADADAGESRPCPRCRAETAAVRVGAASLRECPDCGGVWARREAFERICAGTEEQAAVLGAASTAARPAGGAAEAVRYLPCPECGALMNRVNFARCSGVVIDVCREHGSWFDRDEMRRIVEFIRGGGMSVAREREVMRLEEERRRLERARLAAAQPGGRAGAGDDAEEWTRVLGAASSVLRILRG
jgi:Zn-finger nucleic acid-binding protein